MNTEIKLRIESEQDADHYIKQAEEGLRDLNIEKREYLNLIKTLKQIKKVFHNGLHLSHLN
jgi:hypothetical protein